MNPDKGYNLTLGGEGASGHVSSKRGRYIPVPHLNTPEVRERARQSVLKSGGHIKQICKRGHERTPENIRENRQCKLCEKAIAQKRREKLFPILAALGISRSKYYELKRAGKLG